MRTLYYNFFEQYNKPSIEKQTTKKYTYIKKKLFNKRKSPNVLTKKSCKYENKYLDQFRGGLKSRKILRNQLITCLNNIK